MIPHNLKVSFGDEVQLFPAEAGEHLGILEYVVPTCGYVSTDLKGYVMYGTTYTKEHAVQRCDWWSSAVVGVTKIKDVPPSCR